MVKISAILTTYNSEKTIERTLQSLLNQNGIGIEFNLEIIVIDDFSTDDTISILKKYNCNVIRNSVNSGGPNKGRNLGLSLATGDYLCIVDHDDYWKKDKIESILPFLNFAPIITSGYEVVDVSKNKVTTRIKSSSKDYILFTKNETFINKLTKSLKGQNTYMGSIVFSKSLKHILFEERFGMADFDWLLRLFHQQTSLEVCKVLYERKVDGSNLSLNKIYRKFDFYNSLLTIENYEELYPKETAYAYKRIHGSRARYFYLIGSMRKARFYFIRAHWNLINFLYYVTTYAGSKIVKKHFNVFG